MCAFRGEKSCLLFREQKTTSFNGENTFNSFKLAKYSVYSVVEK